MNLRKRINLVVSTFFCLLISGTLSAQQFSAGINTETPNPNAVLHLVAPNGDQGLLIPSLTTLQRTSMSLTASDNGLMVYDSDVNAFFFWVNPNWVQTTNTDEQDLTNVLSQNNDAGGLAIENVADPINPQDVATKNYVDNQGDSDDQDLELTGNTLSLTNDPTSIDLSPFLDNTDNQNLSSVLASGNDAGAIIITNLPTPTNPSDAATKGYVDANAGNQNLTLTGSDLTIDNGNTIDLSGLGVAGDVTGNLSNIIVDNVGGQSAADVANASLIVNSNPNLDLDSTDDLDLTTTPNASGDIVGDFDTGLFVDFVGGANASDVAAATATVLGNPNLDLDSTDDLDLTTTPNAAGDIVGDFGGGLFVDFVGSSSAADVSTATSTVLGAPALDLDANDDLDLTTVPNGAGDISGDFGGGLFVDFVGGEAAADIATATVIVLSATALDLDANDDLIAGSNISLLTNDVGFLSTETDPTVPANIKDGIDWTELSGIPAGFSDGTDDGILTETQTLGSVVALGNDAGGSIITNVLDPVGASDVATKNYVDTQGFITGESQTLGAVVALGNDAGGSIIANVLDPVAAQDVATKNYVDTQGFITGESQTLGAVVALGNDAGGSIITNVLDPVAAQDVATKNYVDTQGFITGESQTLGAVVALGNDAGGSIIANVLDPVAAQDVATKNYIDTQGFITGESQTLGAVVALGNDAGGSIITNVLDPVAAQDVATKNYVDTQGFITGESQTLGAVVALGNDAGGSIIANVLDPVAAQDVATKNYVDTQGFITGESQTLGAVVALGNDAGGSIITNVLDPVAAQDVATKNYVDTQGFITGESQTLGAVVALGNDAGGSIIANVLDPVAAQDVATKNYIDTQGFITGESQTLGAVVALGNDAGGSIITNVLDPVAAQDVATKNYVDTQGFLTGEVDPVWVGDRTTLGSVGTINNGGNLIDWSQLKGVPAVFADGTDDGIVTETDPTVLASVKDGVDWTEVTSIPAGFADGTDDGIVTEADPVWIADRTTLGSVGTINAGGNLVDWSQLKGVPAVFADGTDDGIVTETDPTVLASVKDGVDWTEVTSIPAGFADGTDDGIVTEADPVWTADRTTLGSVGTINAGGNLVDWSQLKGVPAVFADGTDDGIVTETDPTVLASVKDGVDWTEVTSIPAGFADGTDDGILTVNRNTTLVGDGAGSALGVNVGVAANQIVQLNGSAELPVVDGRNLTGLSRNTSLSDNVPTDGQVLIWDNINSWWEASTPPPTLNSGNGVTINSTNIDLGGALTATANITTNTGFNLVVDGINGEFITSTGTTSFNSSTINLGDAATDDIRVIGEFNFETGVNDLALIVNNQTNATPILRIPDLPSSDETLALQSEITNIVTGTANRIPKINASVDGLEDSDLFTNGVNNQLTVQHTATAIPDFVIHDAGLGDASMQFNRGGAAFFAIGIDYDDSDNFKISSATDVSSNEFVINRVSGNVGLGIGAPSRELHLHDGTGGMSFQMTNSASAGTAANNGFVIDYNDTDQRVDFIHYEGADIAFGDGVQNLYIDNSLNRVGVGINTPQGALDVELSNGSSFFRSSSNVTTGLLHVRHEGGGTGDASMKFTQIGPNFDYTMGIDRGDNNFKINAGTSLAANSDFTITSTGNVEIDQDATIRGNFTTVPAGVVGGTVTVTSRIMPLNADLDDINPGLEGQEVILIATGAININEGANMLLQGGAIGPVGVNSTLHMIFYSGQWIEVSRTIRP